MEGRIYRLRRKNPVNYFTYEDYNNICLDIKGANAVGKNLTVQVTKGKTNLGAFIKQVLAKNGVKVSSYQKKAGSKQYLLMKFESKDDAKRASDIVNIMATPDSINPSKIQTNGDVITSYDLKANVDVTTDSNGNPLAQSGGNYVSGTSDQSSSNGESEEKSSPNWILIGGIAVIGIIALLAVIKLIKK